jgi:hypothetical protein
MTDILFINHASLLVRAGERYLLTDPWHQKPAFGSWLPTFPSFLHPAYLAALGARLTVLISHGHDDHCDDTMLGIFDRSTEIVTANYASPSVKNRLRKLGFERVSTADPGGIHIANGFQVRSFINPLRSLDDATYTVDTGDGLLVHCNDNWTEFDAPARAGIGEACSRYPSEHIAFLSQTNSASGYPLNYRNFTAQQKSEILFAKVRSMVQQGLRNAASLGLRSFGSYAGYASVYVHGHPEYLQQGLLPTPAFLRDSLLTDPESRALLERVSILDYLPGDVLDLSSGQVHRAFVRPGGMDDRDIKDAAERYYRHYGVINECDSFRGRPEAVFDARKLDYFLENLNRFAVRKCAGDGAAFGTVMGKSFEIVVEDLDVRRRVVFGQGVGAAAAADAPPNKRMYVRSGLLSQVLDGRILFENLYTGYEAEWERHPTDVYNRDIVMFIVMYSYVYKNALSAQYGAAS